LDALGIIHSGAGCSMCASLFGVRMGHDIGPGNGVQLNCGGQGRVSASRAAMTQLLQSILLQTLISSVSTLLREA
jgi:hypothetical protein